MAKFGVGDYVRITKGKWEDHGGEIIDMEQPADESLEQRYIIRLPEKPNGVDIPEDCLERATEGMFKEGTIFEHAPGEDPDSPFYEMTTVKGGFESIKIAVFGSEGQIPHFHFYKGCAPERAIPKGKVKGGGCICFMRDRYFIHGNHCDTMNTREIKAMIDFLKGKSAMGTVTRWKELINLWNTNNPDRPQIPYNTPIPKYTSDMGSIND